MQREVDARRQAAADAERRALAEKQRQVDEVRLKQADLERQQRELAEERARLAAAADLRRKLDEERVRVEAAVAEQQKHLDAQRRIADDEAAEQRRLDDALRKQAELVDQQRKLDEVRRRHAEAAEQQRAAAQNDFLAACQTGELATVRPLVDSFGLDVRCQDGAPLQHASRGGHLSLAVFLRERGGDVNQANAHGESPLFLAAAAGHVKVAHFLMEQGALVDKTNQYGQTALIMATYGGHVAIVKELLDRGADRHVINQNGRKAIDVAKTDELKALLTVSPSPAATLLPWSVSASSQGKTTMASSLSTTSNTTATTTTNTTIATSSASVSSALSVVSIPFAELQCVPGSPSLLGRGSFGVVYRALWTPRGVAVSLGVPVALKAMTRGFCEMQQSDYDEERRRARREADLIVDIVHRGGPMLRKLVVEVYGFADGPLPHQLAKAFGQYPGKGTAHILCAFDSL